MHEFQETMQNRYYFEISFCNKKNVSDDQALKLIMQLRLSF